MLPARTKGFSKVTHVIFDNDGTLMNTEVLISKAMETVMSFFGVPFTFELKQRIMGKPSSEGCRLVVEEFKLPVSGEEFERQYSAETVRLMHNVQQMPGVRDLLLHLYESRIPLAIATSSKLSTMRMMWQPHCDLMSVFRHVVCGDDPLLKNGKPAPDIFLMAASRFKPKPRPECCLVFEDSPAGTQAAVAAGMQVVMIPDPRLPKELTKGATLVLESMADFEPELFGLPAYDYDEKFTFG